MVNNNESNQANSSGSPGIEDDIKRLEYKATINSDDWQDEQQKQQVQQSSDSAKEYKEALGEVLAPLFDLLAPNWEIQPQEIDALSTVYAGVLAKYWPGGMSNYGVEIAAAFTTIAIFKPRLGMSRTAKPEEKSEENKKGWMK